MTANTLQLAPVGADQIARFAPLIPGLIRATGPVSYDYQFGVDGLLEQVVAASWGTPDTLFCASCTTAVVQDGELLGIELGFAGPNFYAFKANLVALAPALMAEGKVSYEQFAGLGGARGDRQLSERPCAGGRLLPARPVDAAAAPRQGRGA